MANDNTIQAIEQSLIDFLLRRKGIEDAVPGGARRIRSLTLKFDLHNQKNPIFSVQIGIMEAKFNLKNGLKEQGNCYGIDRYIVDWYAQPTVRVEINQALSQISKIESEKKRA